MRRLKTQCALTLIEGVLSMGLVALLLTSLIFLTSYMWRSQTKVQEMRKSLLAKELLWTRLEDSLSRMLPAPLTPKKEAEAGGDGSTRLLSDGKEVRFSYQPLVTHQPERNTIRQARLYVEQGRLIFETAPSSFLCDPDVVESLRESQVWLEGVDQMRLLFLYIPLESSKSLESALAKPVASRPEEGWNEFWLKDWDKLPQALLVEITQGHHVERWPIWLKGQIAHYLPREGVGGDE